MSILLLLTSYFLSSTEIFAQPVWQSATSGTGSGGTVAVNKPANTVEGDLLIAGFMYESGSGATLTVPSGWTLIRRTDQSSNVGMATYFKRATASEPASYSWGTGGKYSVGISRITGANGIYLSADSSASTAGTAVGAPALATNSNVLVLAFYTIKNASTFTAVSGTTERYDVPNTSGGIPGNMLATYVQTTPGNTGAKTATASASETWASQQIGVGSFATYNTAGSFTFTPPAGVTAVNVLLWGGGGGGGFTSSNRGATGGGGGAFTEQDAVAVSSSTNYPVVVGVGGTGGTTTTDSTNTKGGQSSFNSTIIARGGRGGVSNDAISSGIALNSGQGGTTTGLTNTINRSGGSSARGSTTANTGGSGGGASGNPSNIGNSGSVGTTTNGGSGGTSSRGGGAGGNGGDDAGANGLSGSVPGGGGGGEGGSGTSGGAGANGQVQVFFSCPTYSLTSTTLSGSVCSGNTASISLSAAASSLPVGTYTITYSISGANTASNQTATMTVTTAGSGSFSTVALNSSGSTTITITQLQSGGSSGCTSAISANNTATFSVAATPTASISGTATGCGSVTLTASGGGTYQWSGGSATTSAINTFSTSATYTVTVTSASGCTATSSRVVTVNDIPTASISGSTTGCGSVSLTASGGTTYAWSSGSATTSAVNTITSSGTYTVTATSAAGCTDTETASVTINTAPTASIIGTATGCSIVTLTASGGDSYDWDGGGNSTSAQNTFTISGTYTVTVTAANGCTATASQAVTVNSGGTVFTSATSSSICENGGVTLSAAGYVNTGSAGDFTFAASSGTFTALTGATVVSKLAGDDSVSAAIPLGFTFNAFGSSYTQIYASSNGFLSFNSALAGLGGANTATYTNSINAPNTSVIPLIAPLWDDLSGVGGTASYKTTGTAGDRVFHFEWLNWRWSYTATSPVISFQVKIYEQSGKIEFVYRPETAAIAGTATASIGLAGPSVGNYESVSSAASNATSSTTTAQNSINAKPANGQTFTFSSPAISGYTWSPSTFLNATTGASVSASNMTTSTTYTATQTGGSGCAGSSVITVTVDPPPVITISGNSTICSGLSTTLTASGATSYSWNSGSTAASITVSPNIATTYTVTGTDGNGCTSTATRDVSVNSLPVVSISGTNAICNGSSTTLTASGASSYVWNNGATTAAITVSPSSATTYTVTGTDGNGCTSTATRAVTVNSLPTVSVSGTNTICNGSSTTLTASGASSYVWNTTATTAAITVSPSSASTYSVTGTDANGCTATATRSVAVNTLPTVSISGTNTICNGTSTTLTASGASSYTWNTGATTAAITVSPSSATTYTVTGTDANGCTSTATRAVAVNALPTAGITNNTGVTILTCSTTAISVTATGGTGYSWSGGLGTSASASITSPGTYTATVTDANSCSATASITITQNITAPAAPTASNAARCSTGTVTISATPASGSTIDWYSAAAGGSVLSGGTGVTSFTTPDISATTIYYAETRNTTNGCVSSTRTAVTATVNSLPAAPAAGDADRCGTGIVSISATPGTGETIDWYDAATGGSLLTSSNSSFTTPSISSTTTYYAEARNTTTGCLSATRTAVVATVKSIPSAPTAGNNGPVCAGSTLELTASTITGATYAWTGPNGFTSSSQNPSITSATTAATGTYSVTATVNGCTSAAGTTAATVDATSVGGTVSTSTTVCSGSNSGILTLSGNTGNVVKWQSSVDGGTTWSDITNTTTSQSYSNLTETTQYRAVVQSGVCAAINSSTATITVDPATVAGTVSSDATVCSGTNSGALTLTGNTGSVVKWQSSTNGGSSWSDINNTTTSQNYSNLTQTTQYRAVVKSGVCSSENTAAVTITVDPVSVGGTVSSSTSVCTGSNSGTLTLSGNTGNVVKWQSSVDGGTTWSDITNTTTSQSYSNLTGTTQYRVVVQSGVCAAINSSTATITVDPATVAGTVSSDATVCSGTNSGALTLTGNTGSVVKWQSSTNGGSSWSDINNTTTSQNYSNLTQTTQYRAVVKSGVCSSENTAAVTITVDPVSVGGTVSSSTSVCTGSNSGTLTLSGNTGSVVKWQSSVDGGSTWSDITNTTTSQSYSNLTATTQYRAVIQSGVCAVTNSSTAIITVDLATVAGTVSSDATVCSGTNSGTLTLSGNIGSVVKWQSSTDGGSTWSDISNTTTSQNYSNLTQTTQYRAVVKSGVCSSENTAAVTITVDPVSVGGTVSASATVCSGSNSGTLTLSGNTGNVVKWQSSVDGGTTWSDIANTTTSQSYSNLTATTQYRAVVHSGVCAATNSSAAIITVDPATVAGTVSSDATVCSGTNSGTLTLSGNTGSVVKWQSSTDGGATWSDINNTTTSQSYSNLTQTTQFRAEVQNGVCAVVNSNSVAVTVDPQTVGGSVSGGGLTFCSGNNSGTLNLVGNIGDVIKWQSSINSGASWSDISNTSTSYTYQNLTQSTRFRAVVQSGVCTSKTSVGTNIFIDQVSVGGTVSSSTSVCTGSNSGTLILSGNTGNVVKWQSSVDAGTTWSDITNTTTSQSYSNLTETTQYRAVIQSGVCAAINSSTATITVDPATVAGTVSSDATVCSGTNSGALTLTGNTGSVVKWQSSTNGGSSWSDINNTTTSQNYSNLTQTTQYRAVVKSGVCSSENTAAVTITVDPVSVGGTVSSSTSVCTGSNSGTLTLSGNTGSVVKWQSSVDGGSTWSDITNTTTSQSYSNLTATTQYRAVIQSGVCAATNSSTATITVDPATVAGTVSSDATICSGTNSGTLTLSGNTGSVVKWQSSTDGGSTWSDISNTTTSQNYSNLTQTTQYRAVVKSGVCSSENTAAVTITVDPVSVGGTVSASAMVCTGSNSGILTLSGNTGNVVKWQSSVDGGSTWSDITNTTTSQSYSNLTSTTQYRAVVHSGVCAATNSSAATITVNPNNTISMSSSAGTEAQSVCINTAISTISYTTTGATGATVTGLPTGVNGSWTSDAVTISGTPTVSGTFNYTVTMTGGCTNGTNTAVGSITVNPTNTITMSSSAGTDAQTLCVNTALTDITYTTTGATSATVTGLPAGITGSWSSNTMTISGTPTASGTFNYTVTMTGGCTNGTNSASGSITVTADNTVGAASSTPTLCINTVLSAITHVTTGATGIGTATGLPAGVIASFASNTITITGTPTVSGTFNYSIPLIGGCGSSTATGVITVSADNTVAAASSTPTLCMNTALTAITHATTGATGIGTATGLPAGVSANWASNMITISGTPTVSGTFNYSIPLTGGCANVAASGTIIVNTLPSAVITNNTGASILTCTAAAISVTASGGTSYSWNGGLGTSASASIASPGTYTVTVTDANSCSANASITITQDISAPAAPAATNAARCSTGTVTISATPASGSTIDWYSAASGGSVLSGGTGVTSFTTPSISATTIYYAEARNTTTGCVSATRTAVTATVNALPIPSFTVSAATTNVNTNTTYTTQSGNSAYTWSFSGTSGIDYSVVSGGGSNDNSVTLQWLIAGNQTVSISYTNVNGCTAASPSSTNTFVDNGKRFSIATGNWSSPSTWSVTSGGAAGAPVPSSTNQVFIEGGYTVTLTANTIANGSVTVRAGSTLALSTFTLGAPASLTLECGSLVSGATISGSGLLTLGGDVNVIAIKTGSLGAIISCPVNMGASRTFTVEDDGSTVADLTVSGIIDNGNFNIIKAGAGKVNFGSSFKHFNSLVINSGVVTATSDILQLSGDFVNNSTFEHNNGTIKFYNPSLTQEITGTASFYNLNLGKSSGTVSLLNDVTIANQLLFENGNTATITTGSNALIVSNSSTTSVSRQTAASGFIIGNLKRNIAAGSNSYLFPIGTAVDYVPATLEFTGVSLGGFVTVRTDNSRGVTYPGNLSSAKYLDRSWKVTNDGIGTFSAAVTFEFKSGELRGGAQQGNLKGYKNSAGVVTYPALSFPTSSSVKFLGINSFSEFGLGECAGASLSGTVTNVGCFGASTGAVNITVSGATTPITYSWSGPSSFTSSSEDISGLSAGTYTVSVSDAATCTASGSYSVTQPAAALSASINSTTNVSCYGGSNGAATVSASGGTTAYTYSWTGGGSATSISGKTAGSYTVTVTDANSCTTSATATITEPAAALSASISSTTNVSCFGGNNGASTVSASGGTTAYAYSWTGGGTTTSISSKTAGSYTVTVTDANSCTTTATATITQPAAALSVSTSQTDVLCTGAPTGSASVTPSGGTSGYSYSWTGGSTASSLSNIKAGAYTVTVTDANSCTTSSTVTITQPSTALSVSVTPTHLTCNGISNGSATATPAGGTPSYTYSWTNGGTTSAISAKAAGDYVVTVTDGNGCQASAIASIAQPAPIAVTSSRGASFCASDPTPVSFNVTGGTAPYSTSGSFGNGGVYTVTVTDNNGCTKTETIQQ